MADLRQAPTAYEILGVHSSAPAELISACYWAMAGDLQKKRATEPEADAALHLLMRVYESIADPARRAEYDLTLNGANEPLTKRALPRRRFFLLRLFRRNRYALKWYVDPHEVLGLHPSAPQGVVPVAYRVMRETYLRLPPGSRRQEMLLNLLDDSYSVLGDPQRRAQLDGVEQTVEQELPVPSQDDLPVGDLRESSQSDVAEATVEPPVTDPATEESPTPPETQLRVPDGTVAAEAGPEDAPARDDGPPVSDLREPSQPDMAEAKVALPITDPTPREPSRTEPRVPDGPVAAGEGLEDGGAARRAATAIVAFAAVAAIAVARGVRWTAIAVAALIVVAARFVGRSVRSGWLATVERLRRSWDNWRNKVSVKREAQDEEFLGRLASQVEESETDSRRSSDETTRS